MNGLKVALPGTTWRHRQLQQRQQHPRISASLVINDGESATSLGDTVSIPVLVPPCRLQPSTNCLDQRCRFVDLITKSGDF